MSIFLCLTPCVAFAAQGETDIYGNPIDWDESGIGNEDDAGSDDTFAENSLILPDKEEKSSDLVEDTASVEDAPSSFSETTTTEAATDSSDLTPTGTVIVNFHVPDNWGKDDIVLGLYNITEGEKYDVPLYHDRGYKAEVSLPVGTYEVRSANVSGDLINAQPIHSDTSDFELQANDQQYISLRPAQLEISVESSVAETTASSEQDNVHNEFPIKNLFSLLFGIVIVGVSGITACRYFIHKKEL